MKNISQAVEQLARANKQLAIGKRYPAQVYSVTDRETTGAVECDVFFRDSADGRLTVQVRSTVDLAANDWIYIKPDPTAQGNYVFDGFVKGGGTGNNPLDAPQPWLQSPGVSTPVGEDFTIAPAPGGDINLSPSGGGVITGIDAEAVTFTPAVLTDWDGDVDPGEVNDALDQLAERVDDVEGTGYPFNVTTVDPANPAADYSSLEDALDNVVSGTILVAPGTYTVNNKTLAANVNLIGMDRDATIISCTASNICVTLSANCFMAWLTVNHTMTTASTIQTLYVTANSIELRDVIVTATNNGTGYATPMSVVGNVSGVRLVNCDLTGSANSGNGYGFSTTNSGGGPTVKIEGGTLTGASTSGTAYDLFIDTNSTVTLLGAVLANGAIYNSGTLQGAWLDAGGHRYHAEQHDIYPDGESNVDAGFWTRYVNRYGLSNYTSHAREGSGTPTGFTGWVTTPSNIYVTYDAAYTGYERGTFYRMMPANTSPYRSLLAYYSSSAITSASWMAGRFLVTGGTYVGLRVDNYDSSRAYALNERLYYYEILLYGSIPATQMTYNYGYYTYNGSSWTGPTNTAGTVVTVHPISEGITLAIYINYGANTCYGYIIGEHGKVSGYGSVAMYVDNGVTPFGARRAGCVVLNRSYEGSSWDWWYRSW